MYMLLISMSMLDMGMTGSFSKKKAPPQKKKKQQTNKTHVILVQK